MSSRDLFGDHDDDHGNHFDRYFFFDDDHRDDRHDRAPATSLNATVDVTATDGNGHILNGSGNPAAGWEIQTQGAFQLATDVHYRQGDTVQPTAVTDDGVLVYTMPAGQQMADSGHGVPSNNTTHAATSFDYSFDTGVGAGSHQTIQQFLASGGQFIFKIDLDPGANDNPLVLHAVYDPTANAGGSHVVWEDSHNHIVIADDAGNAYVTQNSQNYAFYQSLIDTDPHTHGIQPGPIGPAGVFDIEEQIIAPHNNVIADITSELDLGGATSPTPHHDLPSTALNSTLDMTATDGNGHTLNGSGNPAAGWETQTVGPIQVGTDVHYRTGDTVQPTAVNDDGSLVYNMPMGSQVVDFAHGVSSARADRAATSFDYSFDTGVGPGPHQTIQDFLASGGQFVFKVDLDPGQHNDPLTLHAVYDASSSSASHVVWETAQGQVVIGDDGGNAFVTQNSQNYAFFQSLIDINPHAPGVQPGPIGPAGTFDVEAQVVNSHHDVIADIHSTLLIG
jgi:hypothetical protein